MGDRMTCPVCGTTTSGVLSAYRHAQPCPQCGLAAATADEILAARSRGADADLTARYEEAIKRAHAAEAEVLWLHGVLDEVRDAVERKGCEGVAVTTRLARGLAHRLRTLADRIDHRGAPKAIGWSFTFEDRVGIRFRDDGKGCPLWYLGEDDYGRAHTEADTDQVIVNWQTARATFGREVPR